MKKKTLISLLFAFMTAFCLLFICSRSSFLYLFNNWDDANSYFSMGKVMMNGGVIYRDSFDQKGPLLYFLYGIGYLLSPTSFDGVFLLEILSMTAFLMAGYKILCLYLPHKLSLSLLPVFAFMVTVSKSFYWGGSAEEFCLPFLGWGLYFSLQYFKTTYPAFISKKTLVLCGFFAGCIMLIKFNILGLYFAWMAVIALFNFNRTNFKKAFSGCLLFLAGMALPLLPWLLYFAYHGALYDWYHAYIYCNVFLYSDLYYEEPVSVGTKIYELAKILYWLIHDNFVYFGCIILGFLGVLSDRKFRLYEKINIYAMFLFLFLGIYIGGTTLFYYSLPLSLFSIFGLLFVGKGLLWIKQKFFVSFRYKALYPAGFTAVYAVILFLAWSFSMNTEYSRQTEQDFWLYDFCDVVCENENPTLLNISCLDAGLYTLTDIIPTCKYFQSNAVHGFDEVGEEQLRYIKEQQTEFVLARDTYPEELLKTYHLVRKQTYASNNTEFVYYLFQKNED